MSSSSSTYVLFQTLLCEQGRLSADNEQPIDCKTFNCPPIDDPICVKMKYLKPEMKNRTSYIIAINKCETMYLKCHKDIITTEIDMKYCDPKRIHISPKKVGAMDTKAGSRNADSYTINSGNVDIKPGNGAILEKKGVNAETGAINTGNDDIKARNGPIHLGIGAVNAGIDAVNAGIGASYPEVAAVNWKASAHRVTGARRRWKRDIIPVEFSASEDSSDKSSSRKKKTEKKRVQRNKKDSESKSNDEDDTDDNTEEGGSGAVLERVTRYRRKRSINEKTELFKLQHPAYDLSHMKKDGEVRARIRREAPSDVENDVNRLLSDTEDKPSAIANSISTPARRRFKPLTKANGASDISDKMFKKPNKKIRKNHKHKPEHHKNDGLFDKKKRNHVHNPKHHTRDEMIQFNQQRLKQNVERAPNKRSSQRIRNESLLSNGREKKRNRSGREKKQTKGSSNLNNKKLKHSIKQHKQEAERGYGKNGEEIARSKLLKEPMLKRTMFAKIRTTTIAKTNQKEPFDKANDSTHEHLRIPLATDTVFGDKQRKPKVKPRPKMRPMFGGLRQTKVSDVDQNNKSENENKDQSKTHHNSMNYNTATGPNFKIIKRSTFENKGNARLQRMGESEEEPATQQSPENVALDMPDTLDGHTVEENNKAIYFEGFDEVQSDFVSNFNENHKIEEFGPDKDVNVSEYNADCPTVCPARDTMLCARCQDGIYRTFMSVCHIRMFSCQHKDEKMELVSREPCAFSAPMLEEKGTPVGRVSEPRDVDLVQLYLMCSGPNPIYKTDIFKTRSCVKFLNHSNRGTMVQEYRKQ